VVGVRERIGAQHHSIDEVEDGRVGAEAKRKGERDGAREQGALEQRAPGILNVLEKDAHEPVS
jgi:hypothetical protein